MITAGMEGASEGLHGPAYPLLQPLSRQSPSAYLWGLRDTVAPSGETTGKAHQQINLTKVIESSYTLVFAEEMHLMWKVGDLL